MIIIATEVSEMRRGRASCRAGFTAKGGAVNVSMKLHGARREGIPEGHHGHNHDGARCSLDSKYGTSYSYIHKATRLFSDGH
jgi:hypothetical protein